MIYFLRHGLDDESKIGGWSDVDLTDIGIQQTKEVSEFIKRNKFEIKEIICSDIKRTTSTAKIVSNILNIPICYTNKLRELNKGNLTGISKEIAIEEYPDYIDNVAIDTSYPNGESLKKFYNRIKIDVIPFLDKENILFITHRGVINMLYFIINNIPLSNTKELFNVEHGSLHEYDKNSKTLKRVF